ncbi:hypothetical protein CDD80_5253 [Ophiocordyceps camponoti-rufipedis]|uniref:Uncharacterized protein n=1 Tax=Ophiocordyceps camponoti-rufipedis TaxID=2004952 RepID=A0A2C5YUM1_9HYPO|nr:hypothetical protein CDD80_5253 [Ophiocordyceps camponoti-rufipedis]
MNLTCNSTLEDMRIGPDDEMLLVGILDFHDLARLIAAACTLVAVVMSLYLVWMHALHYTQPREQRYIIRILFMVPVYAISSFLQLQWYWHAIYFQVISDCYEAFAIASFFALICHYVAPDLHSQKEYFRLMRPIKPWVWPVNWLAHCCGGERGPWRTPSSGLTYLNVVWIGVYHYCFIRVAMTVSAVVSQYFHRYCESSNSPVFGHIWIITLNALAVTIAMFCLIQFYVQLREPLAEHKLLTKMIAIKLVVFLSFWQVAAISVGTSTLNIVHPGQYIAYPDLKVGIPALLLCIEMAFFAIFHLWAFPYKPYLDDAPVAVFPKLRPDGMSTPNERSPPSGGPFGLLALVDALNLWDFVKAFCRGVRWLLCGVKRRKEDVSYRLDDERNDGHDMASLQTGKEPTQPTHHEAQPQSHQPRHQPQKPWSPPPPYPPRTSSSSPLPSPLPPHAVSTDESAGLMDNAHGLSRASEAQVRVGEALWGKR